MTRIGKQSKAMRQFKQTTESIAGQSLDCTEKAILRDKHARIVSAQVTSVFLSFALNWIVEKSMISEHEDNWKAAHIEVN